MDCDDFARATQRARQVAEAFAEAIDGSLMWDTFAPAKFLDGVVEAAGGVCSFASVVSIIEPSLLLRMAPEAVLQELSAVPCETVLDLLMVRCAERAVLLQNATPESVAQEFFTNVFERFAVHAQGALVETRGARWAMEHRDQLRGLMRQYSQGAAELLVANPGARRLGLRKSLRASRVDNLLPGACGHA